MMGALDSASNCRTRAISLGVFRRIQIAAQQLESQIDQIGVEHVCFAISRGCV